MGQAGLIAFARNAGQSTDNGNIGQATASLVFIARDAMTSFFRAGAAMFQLS